jgi:hypothetical protein
MKKILNLAAASAVITLLFSSLSMAQPETTITITKTVTSSGAKICYTPSHRTVTATRTMRRCGPAGMCRDIRITRQFEVMVNEDCHMVKSSSCPKGYKSFGWYPNQMEARQAVQRCRHTINGNVPTEWNVAY